LNATPNWRETPTYPTLWIEHTSILGPVLEPYYLKQSSLDWGENHQASSFIPPSTGQPYLGMSNPIWGSNSQPNAPVQGNNPNQYNPINYLPPHQQLNLPRYLHYIQTSYGPIGIPTGIPSQSHQYPHMNRQLPFLATMDLPDLSRILNDPIRHSP
jgi:hypothetical protein